MEYAIWEGLAVLAIGLLYARQGYWAWAAPGAIGLAWWWQQGGGASTGFQVTAGLLGSAALLFGVAPLRRALLSGGIMKFVTTILPRMGETERIALEAGTVWWDGQIFSGNPDWSKLLAFRVQPLSAEEQAFIDGPVEKVCAMIHDFNAEQAGDLPKEVWDILKREKFLGMIIPKAYGGLEFSAAAQSAVIVKLGSRNGTAAVSVMVPNSLGPAELLLHYGTEDQKNYYLPRLAIGEELPCFALTGPEAGSDAGGTQSTGVVCRGVWEGKEVLGMRLNWRKRYITLAPVATVLGLAFKLLDPDHLIGDKDDLGITCALVPADLPGIEIGDRHDPLGNSFMNGPTFGTEVFVPLDFIIGGQKMAGQGWRMLMECLAAGRSISLPASACAAAQGCVRATGAYATIREQFDMPIGRFEGIEEPLARIGGLTYLIDSMRRLTAGAVDSGEKPSVISAIAKRWSTETQRQIVNDAMDIVAGAGISQGERNVIARAYLSTPIGITVEGANILTRTLIVFGQGAIRCHPFVQTEMRACAEKNVAKFDGAFWGHINFVFSNAIRSLVLGLTDGAPARPSHRHAKVSRYLGQLSRLSAAFALCSDAAMGTLGGSLKGAQKLSGRLADALAYNYMASAAVKRFVDEGCKPEHEPFMDWSVQYGLYQVEEALAGFLDNLPLRPAAWALRLAVFPTGRRYKLPTDRTGSKVARALLDDRQERLDLTRNIYIPKLGEPGLGLYEEALDAVVAAQPAVRKLKEALRSRKLNKFPEETQVARALEAGVLTAEDKASMDRADAFRDDAIQVDSFPKDSVARRPREIHASPVREAVSGRR